MFSIYLDFFERVDLPIFFRFNLIVNYQWKLLFPQKRLGGDPGPLEAGREPANLPARHQGPLQPGPGVRGPQVPTAQESV